MIRVIYGHQSIFKITIEFDVVYHVFLFARWWSIRIDQAFVCQKICLDTPFYDISTPFVLVN
jgi:hypothetical protein